MLFYIVSGSMARPLLMTLAYCDER